MLGWMLGVPQDAYGSSVRILGASSLTESLVELTQGQSVSLGFGGSGRIANQVLAGAPVDIVALAHPDWTAALTNGGFVHTSRTVLSNQLVVAARPGHATAIQNLSTLKLADRIAIGSQTTPAGQYAREALQRLGIDNDLEPKLVHANNVRAVLAHIASGTVDAGFVYQTDLHITPSIEARFVVDPNLHTPIQLQFILTRMGATNPEAIALFDEITGKTARHTFTRYGFHPADPNPVAVGSRDTAAPEMDFAPIVLSIWVAAISLIVSILPAIGLAWLMARKTFRFKAILSTLCLSPLVLPPVVTGWMLLKIVTVLSLPFAFTKWAAVIAAAVVGFPLLLILTRQAIESVDVRYAQLGETLGMTPFEAFYRITLPMARPGIAAGCVLAFARALGEFGATAMIAGDQPGETRTLALAVYSLTEQPGGTTPAAILIGFSILITLAALLAYEKLVWRQRRLTGENA